MGDYLGVGLGIWLRLDLGLWLGARGGQNFRLKVKQLNVFCLTMPFDNAVANAV